MGVTAWFFLRHRPGELRPLPRARVESFVSGGGRLVADAEGFVRCAQVVVDLEERRAVRVLHVDFVQYRALEDGTLDREHFREMMAVIPVAAFGWLGGRKMPPGVIDAEHRFAQRRLEQMTRWKPTRSELATLRELVNARAGCGIM